jgi:hypothetical protein
MMMTTTQYMIVLVRIPRDLIITEDFVIAAMVMFLMTLNYEQYMERETKMSNVIDPSILRSFF